MYRYIGTDIHRESMLDFLADATVSVKFLEAVEHLKAGEYNEVYYD